jgi:hypothetical protein
MAHQIEEIEFVQFRTAQVLADLTTLFKILSTRCDEMPDDVVEALSEVGTQIIKDVLPVHIYCRTKRGEMRTGEDDAEILSVLEPAELCEFVEGELRRYLSFKRTVSLSVISGEREA